MSSYHVNISALIKDLKTPPLEGVWQNSQWSDADQYGNMYSVETPASTRVKGARAAQLTKLRPTCPQVQVAHQPKKHISEDPLICDEGCSGEENLPFYENVPSEEMCIIEGEPGPLRGQQQLFEDEDLYDLSYGVHDKTFLNNFEEVEQLIHDEGEDVTMALRLQNRWSTPQSQASDMSTQDDRNRFQPPQKSPYQYEDYEESDDEVSPEVAAAMMHSEEQGILMGAAPLRVYNALFSDDENDLIAVTSAAPFHPQNVVVPVSVDNLPYTTSAEDLAALASAIRGKEPLPSNSVFADNVKQRGIYNSVISAASMAYVTEPTEATGSSENTSKSSLPSASGGTIEYVLDPASPPDHYSRIQLRGSTSPDWFPGYFEALPSIDGITAVCRDPSTVVEEAWSTLQSTLA